MPTPKISQYRRSSDARSSGVPITGYAVVGDAAAAAADDDDDDEDDDEADEAEMAE